jgi:hypothetical protein
MSDRSFVLSVAVDKAFDATRRDHRQQLLNAIRAWTDRAVPSDVVKGLMEWPEGDYRVLLPAVLDGKAAAASRCELCAQPFIYDTDRAFHRAEELGGVRGHTRCFLAEREVTRHILGLGILV